MSTPTGQHQHSLAENGQLSMNHDASSTDAVTSVPAVTATANSTINNGNFIQRSNTPQVQVHISEVDGTSPSTSLDPNTHASAAGGILNQQQQSGSSAASSSPSGSYTQSHLNNVASTGTSPYTTPSPGLKNASLAAPRPVPYGQPLLHGHGQGQGGLPMQQQHGFDGRISPRPVSRNQTRTPQYHHNNASYNSDGYNRPPGETRTQLFVGNLPFRVRWQDLKDLFRKCGSVLRSDVALTLDNRSKGFGTVLYANEEDARNAIETFNGYTWQSRVLDVRVDQQDPTGSISMANAAAQQAQYHAHQTHQQAMQNMANMVGVAQNVAAAAMFQQGYPMFAAQGGAGASPWMAAAMANNFRPGSNFLPPPPMGQSPNPPHAGLPQFNMPGRAPSPYKPVQLGNDLANLSLRRNSSSTEASSRPSIPHSGSSSSLGAPRGRGDSLPKGGQPPSNGSSSRPGTSPASPVLSGGGASGKTGSPTPATGFGDNRESISPTSARRPPPGSLGPMPPSIFASMPQNAHLPNPPAAAAAAVAAGYSIEEESAGTSRHTTSPYGSGARELSSNSRRNSANLQDPSAHPGHQLRQQQSSLLEIERSASPLSAQNTGNAQVPAPFPGGLANFYQQQQQQQPRGHGLVPNPYNGGRTSPSPSLADRQLFVGNIPFNCQWQDLKDLFRAAGQIQRADVSLGPDGRSRGFGRVVFATPEDAINAMQMFNGYEFQGRPLKVHFDKFAPGGSPFSQVPQLNMQSFGQAQDPIYNGVHQSHFIQPSNMQNGNQQYQNHNAPSQANNQSGYTYLQNGQIWQPPSNGLEPSFDDNNSVPGTPIHEMSLAQMAAFPSPGFSSPMQQQQAPGQPSDMRGRGFNSNGMSIAPIGSGAPHGHQEHRLHLQQGHPMPLSPLMIPPMSMAMPSPGPGGLFSPPLPGMGPLMTPSMPGFSFHPFPQTPPLLPQFLSPGLGPFSPPLGTPGTFFGYNGPSALRNSAPGDNDSTPLQSPDMQYPYQQQGNYFPPLPDQPQGNENADSQQASTLTPTTSAPVNGNAVEKEDGAEESPEAEAHGSTTPTLAQLPSSEDPVAEEVQQESSDAPVPSGRRASFKDSKSNSMLGVPTSSNNRGGSLDIPRPNLHLGDITSGADNGSAVDDDDDGTPPAAPSPTEAAPQSKKSAWNLSWLKKQ